MRDNLLEVKNLSVAYGTKAVLEQISFTLSRGDVVAVVGASGSGKSTLLNTLMGLGGKTRRILSGSIKFKGQEILAFHAGQWRTLRGKDIAKVHQDTGASFCPIRKIGAQLYEQAQAHGNSSKEDIKERANQLMEKMNLPFSIWDEYPFRLSGGMAQRVGILSALLLKPTLILADEPTSALDTVTQVQVVKELLRLRTDMGLSLLLVTHQLAMARAMANYVLIMQQGRIVEAGPCESVFKQPQHAYTKELLAAAAME